ncbi:Ion transport 2 domain protein [Operophtera brumata]|uniref:Ion transport 2 domain protein n=1 Tax=Operophtera brumata TaxID=104452 RepID=A0A0L7LPC5_OPEBR|nr:Ion transport 2 domain protein [Operophtera brumata]
MVAGLQLVSRLPCVLSAPYLQEAAHAPGAGRVSEPSDTDRVLRFIRCRELSDSSRAGTHPHSASQRPAPAALHKLKVVVGTEL